MPLNRIWNVEPTLVVTTELEVDRCIPIAWLLGVSTVSAPCSIMPCPANTVDLPNMTAIIVEPSTEASSRVASLVDITFCSCAVTRLIELSLSLLLSDTLRELPSLPGITRSFPSSVLCCSLSASRVRLVNTEVDAALKSLVTLALNPFSVVMNGWPKLESTCPGAPTAVHGDLSPCLLSTVCRAYAFALFAQVMVSSRSSLPYFESTRLKSVTSGQISSRR